MNLTIQIHMMMPKKLWFLPCFSQNYPIIDSSKINFPNIGLKSQCYCVQKHLRLDIKSFVISTHKKFSHPTQEIDSQNIVDIVKI